MFTWLDGALILFYIGATTLIIGGAFMLALRLAGWLLGQRELPWRLAYALTPLAGSSVFLGLSALTVSMLKAERLALPWVPQLRIALLAAGLLWSGWLLWRMLAKTPDEGATLTRRTFAWAALMGPAGLVAGSWIG